MLASFKNYIKHPKLLAGDLLQLFGYLLFLVGHPISPGLVPNNRLYPPLPPRRNWQVQLDWSEEVEEMSEGEQL